nr:DUF1653 domain-containing protein [Rivibacter subsaxonicus]
MNETLPPLPTLPIGRYRHYKGGRYEVIGVARHSETHEALVVYRPLYGEGALWVRPFGMFVGTVVIDGVERRRFAPEAVGEGSSAERPV